MSQSFLIDVDEVCVEWLPGFLDHMRRHGHHALSGDPSQFDLTARFPGVEWREEINRFALSQDYWQLPPVPGAADATHWIKMRYPNSVIMAVSCCGTDLPIKRARMYQLREFAFDGLICLPAMASKTGVYSQFKQGVVIDDGEHNLLDAMVCGHVAMAFDRPWNRKLDKIKRIRSWAEFMQ